VCKKKKGGWENKIAKHKSYKKKAQGPKKIPDHTQNQQKTNSTPTRQHEKYRQEHPKDRRTLES